MRDVQQLETKKKKNKYKTKQRCNDKINTEHIASAYVFRQENIEIY